VRSQREITKQIAHAYDAKVNDVVLTAVAGGLRDLLAGRGESVEGLAQRAMVTISDHQERDGQAQGNKPGWMMVTLPSASRMLCAVSRSSRLRRQRASKKLGRRQEAASSASSPHRGSGTGSFRGSGP
jgi:hypothetical protein